MNTALRPPSDEERSDALQALLTKACVPDAKGKQNIEVLARRHAISFQSVYKWIKKGRIEPDRAKEIVDKSEGRVKIEEFTPFFFS